MRGVALLLLLLAPGAYGGEHMGHLHVSVTVETFAVIGGMSVGEWLSNAVPPPVVAIEGDLITYTF
jgi:hypothetical protein